MWVRSVIRFRAIVVKLGPQPEKKRFKSGCLPYLLQRNIIQKNSWLSYKNKHLTEVEMRMKKIRKIEIPKNIFIDF